MSEMLMDQLIPIYNPNKVSDGWEYDTLPYSSNQSRYIFLLSGGGVHA
jgi:hypothetical protein